MNGGAPHETCRRCGDFLRPDSRAAIVLPLCKACFENVPAPPSALGQAGLSAVRRYALLKVGVWLLCLGPAVWVALRLDSGLAPKASAIVLIVLLVTGGFIAFSVSALVVEPRGCSVAAREILEWSKLPLDSGPLFLVEVVGDAEWATVLLNESGLFVVGVKRVRFAASYSEIARANVVVARIGHLPSPGLEIHRADGASVTFAPSPLLGRRRARRELDAIVARLQRRADPSHFQI